MENPSGLRERVLLALRRLGIGTAQGEGFNKLDKLMGKSQGFTTRAVGRDPRMSNVVLLARALKVRLEWLATGEGPMETEGDAVGETYAMLPGWPEAAGHVKGVPRYAIIAVGRRPVLLRPDAVTPEFVRALAGFWLSWSADVEEEERRSVAALAQQETDAGAKRHT